VQAGHLAVVDRLVDDLATVAAALRASGARAEDRSTTYGTA
jgi:hypothetical protein